MAKITSYVCDICGGEATYLGGATGDHCDKCKEKLDRVKEAIQEYGHDQIDLYIEQKEAN